MNRRHLLLASPACLSLLALPGLALARSSERPALALCGAPCGDESLRSLKLAAVRPADVAARNRHWSLSLQQPPSPPRLLWSLQRGAVLSVGRPLRQALGADAAVSLSLDSTCVSGHCQQVELTLAQPGSYLLASARADGSLPAWHGRQLPGASEADLIELMNAPATVDYDAIVLTLAKD